MSQSSQELRIDIEQLTDKQLLAQFSDGDESAFTRLVERHAEMVRAVCLRVLQNSSDSDDAFQATFFILASRASKVAWQDSIAGWLHHVARRVSVKLRTNIARRRSFEADSPAKQTEACDDPVERIGIRELGAILDNELAKMPNHLRDAIVVTQFEGLSRAEAATRLGTSVAVVKDRLERGREFLRKRLLKRGITLTSATLAVWFVPGSVRAVEMQNLIEKTGPLAVAFAAGKLVSAQLTASVALAEAVLKAAGMQKLVTAVVLLVSLVTGGSVALGFLQDNPGRFEKGLRGHLVSIDQGAKPSLTIKLDEFDALLNLDIALKPKVWIAFEEGQLDRLKPGQLISLQLGDDNRTIEEIHAQGPVREAVVKSIGTDDTLVIEADDDNLDRTPVTLQLSRDTIVRLGAMAATRDELSPGMSVPLEFGVSEKVVHAIEAEWDSELMAEGTLHAIDVPHRKLVVLMEDESDQLRQRACLFSETVQVTRDGKAMEIKDLEAGSVLKLRYAPNGETIMSVMVLAPREEN